MVAFLHGPRGFVFWRGGGTGRRAGGHDPAVAILGDSPGTPQAGARVREFGNQIAPVNRGNTCVIQGRAVPDERMD